MMDWTPDDSLPETAPEDAGYRYAMRGLDCVLAADYQPTQKCAEGATDVLRAISADVRAGNQTRATGHTRLLFPLLDCLRDDAEPEALQALAVE